MKIKTIHAREILASGGYPTVEAEVELADGNTGVASVPYGASAGSHEAFILTDNDPARWQGHGVLKAIGNITTSISSALVGLEANDQKTLDQTMIALDGSPNKSNLGGNAILAVSLAAARAGSIALQKPLYRHIIDTYDTGVDLAALPHPMAVVIEGGKHAANSTDLQEYCFTGLGGESVKESLRSVLESYHALRQVLAKNNLSTNVGNEGAFAPEGIASNEAPFAFMLEAISNAGLVVGHDVGISVDAAASEFYKDGKYHLKLENKSLDSQELIEYYRGWLDKYPIITIEDMLHEDDWDNWPKMKALADNYHIPLIGDDLTVTNITRLRRAVDSASISGLLVKLNQIGTLSETVECARLARSHGIMTVTSHRGGGESNDTAMIDVAVALGSSYVKVGPTRGERVAKYNRLLEIERELLLNI